MTATPDPRRIQLRRTKGWRKPPGAVVVARPTRWGNPFVVVDTRILFRGTELWSGFRDHTAAVRHAVLTFGWHIDHHPDVLGFTRDQVVEQLHGKDLACWCPLLTDLGLPAPCHANVLLAIASPGPRLPTMLPRSAPGLFSISSPAPTRAKGDGAETPFVPSPV